MPALQPSPYREVFVGREREFIQLRDGLEEACEGRGRLFLIHGEPGIGKTSLAEQVANLARQRATLVLWGRCWEGDGAPAYWPWIQIMRALVASLDADGRHQLLESEHAAATLEAISQIVPGLFARSVRPGQPATPRAPQSQFILFDSVATLLRDAARLCPIVIFLDDLHDADAASLRMLQFVARELRTSSVLLIGTYREAEVKRSPALSAQIGELAREARSLPLVGLSAQEVADFFNQVIGPAPDVSTTERLHEATAGNPLFVDGVVRGLMTQAEPVASQESFSIPHSVREAIGLRLAKLSEQARAVLEIAAAIGNEFDAAICARVKKASREQVNSWLDEAARDGIVIALGQGRYRFAHTLIRSAIYDTLDTNARVRLHSAVGTSIEELYAQDLNAHLDELAHHFRAAGVIEKAIDYSFRAGTAARAVFAYAAAAAHWRAARALTEGQRDARRAELLFRLGETEGFFVDPPQGIAHLQEALDLYRELKEKWPVANTAATLGLALIFQADFAPETDIPRGLGYLRDAQQYQGDWPSLSLGWLHQGLAVASFQQLRLDDAISNARRATQIWREASIPLWTTSEAAVAQYLMLRGRQRESAALIDEVLCAVQGIVDPGQIQNATWTAAWIQMLMRNPVEARRVYAMGTAHRGISSYQNESNFEFLGFTEFLLGNLVRSKEIAKAHRMNPLFRSWIALYDGDLEEAIELRRAMIEWARRAGHLWDVVDTSGALAGALYLAGDTVQALQVLDGAIELHGPSYHLLEISFRSQAVLLEVEMGRPERATVHLEVCRRILAEGEDWKGRAGIVDRAEGILAAAEGRPFAKHFEDAIVVFKRFASPLEEAETLVNWGRALLSEDSPTDADAKFAEAIAIYRRCGAGERWIDLIGKRRAAFPHRAVVKSPARASRSAFRHEGDFWTIAYGGKTSRLRNVKGLGYIAHLLGRPGERVHVIDLVQAIEGGAEPTADGAVARAERLAVERSLGDAGDALDPQALEEYRRRQSELRGELDTARRDNDPGRIEAAQHEFEMISNALAGALGRSGRARRNLSHVERARSLLTKHIRSAIDLIRRSDPDLASHLDRSIQTGAHCAYLPQPREKVDWQM